MNDLERRRRKVAAARIARALDGTDEADVAVDTDVRILQLVESLPSLAEAMDIDGMLAKGWDPGALDAWAGSDPGVTAAAQHAARFVLSVWNPTTTWSCGRFGVHAALSVWDLEHREAFLLWAARPWWP